MKVDERIKPEPSPRQKLNSGKNRRQYTTDFTLWPRPVQYWLGNMRSHTQFNFFEEKKREISQALSHKVLVIFESLSWAWTPCAKGPLKKRRRESASKKFNRRLATLCRLTTVLWGCVALSSSWFHKKKKKCKMKKKRIRHNPEIYYKKNKQKAWPITKPLPNIFVGRKNGRFEDLKLRCEREMRKEGVSFGAKRGGCSRSNWATV